MNAPLHHEHDDAYLHMHGEVGDIQVSLAGLTLPAKQADLHPSIRHNQALALAQFNTIHVPNQVTPTNEVA